ncbi:hypothetical protein PPTG_08746 [Phytophthora nicotianae INRA-310]|uniref:HAT C-terminal dimerisation domain-containing protein n=1 Tax=Phytophthora nicotianae (strain INRA-310) TaxID=761204 RepID=W2QIE9_PHYN3|nr:hypothetical protein PPTG_08746 [Phytophthora nicotianae INRA-310]ETN12666.1 hypothetical protein PPTG_08746 [Phytophthora nicotianae INRA-310]
MSDLISFAHDLNNLVKAILKSECSTVARDASDARNTINTFSSKWLQEAELCMRETYGYDLCLQQLGKTRWNSTHVCFASLLRVYSALEMLELKFRDKDDFPNKLRVFGRATFWNTLADAVRPLSYASFKLEKDENTMADVVVCYLDIFTGFSRSQYTSSNLNREVEKRWLQCEQPLMLLALFLHPAHKEPGKQLVDKRPLTSVGSLCRIGVYYFRRFNLSDDTTRLFENLHWYWLCTRTEMRGSKLPTLAVAILSIVVNTATCERYFSELALIHTAKRNRMDPEKARKLALVRKRVRENGCADSGGVSKRRRLTDPTERKRLRDRDDRFTCCNGESDMAFESVVGSGCALQFWADVLCELESDDDPPVVLAVNNADTATATTEAERFNIKVMEI